MIHDRRIIVVMPAYQAEGTLRRTFDDIPKDIVDEIILVDDASTDRTAIIARELGIRTIIHDSNRGYGGNQKTCYRRALALNADIVIMLHPDYQYDPKLITALASMIASGCYDVALASRIISKGALAGGMPFYKYASNRGLTFVQNLLLNHKLSEYHTGYRAYSAEVLRGIPWESNSNDFLFDNEILVQIIHRGYRIGEISCPTRYIPESSSIRGWACVTYGLGVLLTSLKYVIHKSGFIRFPMFEPNQSVRQARMPSSPSWHPPARISSPIELRAQKSGE